MDEFDGLSFGEPYFSFRAPDEDELLIAALEGGLMPSDAEDSTCLPISGLVAQSEFDVELPAMLSPGHRRNQNGMESSTLS